jgi:hypothetical protein
MRTEKIYIADDGKRFEGYNAYAECRKYELAKSNEKYAPLAPYIEFFDWAGKPICYGHMEEGCYAYYAHVKDIPDEGTPAYEMWGRIVPENLDCQICDDLGWYVSNGDDRWYAWVDMVSEFAEKEKIINELNQERGA